MIIDHIFTKKLILKIRLFCTTMNAVQIEIPEGSYREWLHNAACRPIQ